MNQRRFAVIGAGVIGAALSHRLSGSGADVTLLDQDLPGLGTSRWSLAWFNANGDNAQNYHDLRTLGMRAWGRLAQQADGAAWYRPVGNLRWADSADGCQTLTDRVTRLRTRGYPAEMLNREQALRLEPAVAFPAGVREVAWFPDEGYILTEPLVATLTGLAQASGTEIRTGNAGRVTGVTRSAHGGWTIRTADGSTSQADVVVSCTGRWTREVTGLFGPEVPIVDPEADGSPAPGLVVRAGPVSPSPRCVVHTPTVHVRPHGADGVHLESGDAEVGTRTSGGELDRWADVLLERARRIVPGLAGAQVRERRVCVRPLPLDGLPVIGALGGGAGGAGRSDSYVIVTHSGVTLAAGLAELAARELLDGVRLPELAPFRPERFAGPGTARQ